MELNSSVAAAIASTIAVAISYRCTITVKGVEPSGSWPLATEFVAAVRLLRRGLPLRRRLVG